MNVMAIAFMTIKHVRWTTELMFNNKGCNCSFPFSGKYQVTSNKKSTQPGHLVHLLYTNKLSFTHKLTVKLSSQ